MIRALLSERSKLTDSATAWSEIMMNRLLKMLILLAVFAAAAAQAAGYLYRYTNSQGKTEIASAVPNDRARFGYDVLDHSGRVVRRVDAELSGEALERKKIKEARQAECLEAYRRVSALYQYETEIDHAKGKALDALSMAIENDQANLAHARNQHEQLLEQAARMERSGKALSEIVVQNIDRAAGQVRTLTESIRQRQGERTEIERRFEQERETFRGSGDCHFGTETAANG